MGAQRGLTWLDECAQGFVDEPVENLVCVWVLWFEGWCDAFDGLEELCRDRSGRCESGGDEELVRGDCVGGDQGADRGREVVWGGFVNGSAELGRGLAGEDSEVCFGLWRVGQGAGDGYGCEVGVMQGSLTGQDG